MKKTTHYKGHRWTQDELRNLMALWAAGEQPFDIAQKLNVTQHAVAKMVIKLRQNGIPLQRRTRGHITGRHNQLWTQGEVEYLLRRRAEKATLEEIGTELGRTFSAINGMITRLRSESVPVAMLGMGVRRLWNADALKAVAVQSPEQNVIALDAKA